MVRVKLLTHLGRHRCPNFFLSPPKAVDSITPPKFFFLSFTAAEGDGFSNARRRRPKGGAQDSAPSEGEGNHAEGGCFASVFDVGYT